MLNQLLKDSAQWFFWHPFRAFIYLLPIKTSYIIGNLIGNVSCFLMRGKRELMKKELLNILNGETSKINIGLLLKKAFSSIALERIEILLFPKLNKGIVNKLCSFDGLDNLDEALKKKKGAILLIAHFGNQRFILPALGFFGYKVNQLGAPPTAWKELFKSMSKAKAKALEIELECEKSLPVKFIYYDKFMRPAFDCLASNEVLVIAGDSGGEGRKVEVDFLNRTAMISPGVFNLAKKSGAPVLPVFIIRNNNDAHTVKIEERLNLSMSGNKKEDEINNIKQFIHLLEYYVKKFPCHYLKHLWWVQSRSNVDPVPFFKRVDKEVKL